MTRFSFSRVVSYSLLVVQYCQFSVPGLPPFSTPKKVSLFWSHLPWDLTWLFIPLFPDAFPVTVATFTGQSAEYYVRPSEYVVDLKEKISLAQGFPIAEQNLVFQQTSLVNSTTLSSCGVSRGAELTLMSVGTSTGTTTTTTTYFTSILNPSLSIAHFTLGLRLDSLLVGRAAPVSPPNQAHRQPLPPHLSHIVHVHDVPYEGFQMLLVYLYSRQLMEPPNCK